MITIHKDNSLRINEIFKSLQGESSYQGCVTTFIRLTGCPLRCQYCDTTYAFKGGERLSFDEIVNKTKTLGAHHVCVTGGEPLAQPGAYHLINRLAQEGYSVSVETSGAFSIEGLDSLVKVVMDIKTPGSKEESKNLLSNLAHIKDNDEIKFVICDFEDFQWASQFVSSQLTHLNRHQVLFSPSYHQVTSEQLAQWMIENNTQARLQIQLHKYLWGEKQGV